VIGSRRRHGLAGAGSVPRPNLNLFTPARREVWSRAATHALCGIAPVFFTFYMIVFAASHHGFAYDFDRAFWPAGARVLHGLTPYSSPTSFAATHGFAFVYPAPGALLFAAFAWMPRVAADVLFTVICIAAALGTLRILGVRDWRVYGVTMLWAPVISGWQTANLSLLLALGIAVAWKYRDRPVVAGVAVGLMVSLKLFLWPLFGWLLLSRRWRATGWAAFSAVAANIAAWVVVGFSQVSAYTDLVRAVTKVEEVMAYTPLALALRLGAGHVLADLLAALAVVVVGYVTFRCARQHRESAVLLGAITISLLATPIVWRHYFVLFLVPLAISRPRLSALWAIPVVMLPFPVTGPSMWQLLVALGAIGFLVYSLFRWPTQVTLARRAPVSRGAPLIALQGSGAPVANLQTVDSTSARS
jgi:hypothetical protein